MSGSITTDTLAMRQGSAAGTPAAGKVHVYWKTGDEVPYIKDSAGVEYAVLLDSVPAANKILLDGQAEAWAVVEGANRYLVFKTADGAEETIVGADPAGVATAKLTLRAGSGGWAATSTGPMDLDAAGSVGINSSAGPINIGDDAVNQAINVGTQGTRTLTRGSATATIVETAASFTWNIKDNVATPWTIQQGANKYYEIITTDGSEEIKYGNATTNPKHTFLGSGLAVFGGNLDVTGDLTPGSYTQVAGAFTYNVAGSAYAVTALSATLIGAAVAANAVRLQASDAAGGIDIDYGMGGVDFAGTGAFVVNIADNAAAIFKIQEGANVYLVIDTTNGAEKFSFTFADVFVGENLDVVGTITTKHGQGTNPPMLVPGLLYDNDAASAEVANTATETAFDKAPAQLAANTFAPLRRLRVHAAGTVVDTNGGAQQVTLRIRVLVGAGPATVVLASLVFNANDSDVWVMKYEGHVLAAGAPGTRLFRQSLQTGSGASPVALAGTHDVSAAVDTTQALTVQVSAEWLNLHADNRIRMDFIEVELG